MAWVVLVIAGLFEVGWAIGLKYYETQIRVESIAFQLSLLYFSVVNEGRKLFWTQPDQP